MKRPVVATAVTLSLAALAFAAGPASQPAATGGDSDLPPAQLADLQKPLSYFNANCASCHGDYGNFWGKGFAADKTDRQLREVVMEMCNGPAQAPLEGRALDAQVAYNRSLKTETPFATAYVENGKLRGEVTPGATVTLVVDGKDVEASVDGHAWTSDAASALTVRVEKDGKTATLDPAAGKGAAFADAESPASPASPESPRRPG